MNNLGLPNSPLLTIHFDRLFSESAYGKRIAREMEGRSAVLMAENRRIESELRAEELDLAERRATMEADAFRALATAFDQKVQETRRTQEAKFLEITTARDDARRAFRETSIPILEQIMSETGAAVILEQSTVLLSAEAIDVTDLAISRVDAILGEGNDSDGQEADLP
nr:OmpH family outer membrane protein [Tritonibacter horizontis]